MPPIESNARVIEPPARTTVEDGPASSEDEQLAPESEHPSRTPKPKKAKLKAVNTTPPCAKVKPDQPPKEPKERGTARDGLVSEKLHKFKLGEEFVDAADPVGLGKILAAARKKAGFTQVQVADKMDSNQGNIGRLERGENDPQWTTVCRYAEAIEMSIADIFCPKQ